MKRFLIIFFLLLSYFSFSQSRSCYIGVSNRANPGAFLREVYDLRKDNKYDSIISILQVRMVEDSVVKPYYHHQLACYYALKKDYDKSFANLHKALSLGISINDVLTDTDIELLYNEPEWKNVKNRIYEIYLKNNPNILDTNLSLKLWEFGIEDQRYRTLMANNKRYDLEKNSLEYDSISKAYNQKIKEAFSFVKSLVHHKKWPLYSEVGKEAGEAAFLIIQHSGNNRLTKKALKLIEVAVKKGEASKPSYALMLDRYLMHKHKKQIYGSQAISYSNGVDENGKVIMGKHFLWPIEDEVNVNKRRKEMGMNSIEENSKRFGIDYKYNPEYDKIKCRKLVKLLRDNSMN